MDNVLTENALMMQGTFWNFIVAKNPLNLFHQYDG